ncbi:MAG: DUF5693 family protein [Moorellaceae bacterium]
MNKRLRLIVLWVLVALGALAALWPAVNRMRAEAANRAITIAVDYQEVAKLAWWTGLPEEVVLQRLKEKGVNAILFKEETVADLRAGSLQVMNGEDARWLLPGLKDAFRSEYIYLVTGDQGLGERIKEQIENKVAVPVQVIRTSDFLAVGVPFISLYELDNVGLGFPPDKLERAAEQGFRLAVQIKSWPGANSLTIRRVMEPLLPFKPYLAAVLFNDSALPGYPSYLPVLAEEVKKLGAPVGIIEFVPQQGLRQLALLLDKQALRVHTILPKDMATISPSAAVERFTLAAGERNVRFVFVRLFFRPGSVNWLEDNLNYLEDLRRSLAREGLVVGQARPLGTLPSSRAVWVVIGAGVAAGGVLLLESFGLGRGAWILGILGFLGWTGALGWGHVSFLRKAMALAAAVIFPTLSVWLAWERGKPQGLFSSVGVILKSTVLSMLGGLMIVGLLSDTSFMLQLDQFMGVKAAFILPLVIFGGAVLYKKEKGHLGPVVRRWLGESLTVILFLALVVGIAAVLLYVSRSGNESFGLLPLEGSMRDFLERVLGVRPRTKEFLLGYPFFLWALTLNYRHRYLPLWLLALAGQISVVNTLCHIHTPLAVSLLRIFNGWWVGILLGGVSVVGYAYALKAKGKWSKSRFGG